MCTRRHAKSGSSEFEYEAGFIIIIIIVVVVVVVIIFQRNEKSARLMP